jgi:hypothetical protein
MCRVWTYLSRGFNSSGHTGTDHLGISGIQHVPKVSLIDRRRHGIGDNFGEDGCGNYYLLKRKNSVTSQKIREIQREVIKALSKYQNYSFLGGSGGSWSNDRFQGFDGRFHEEIDSCGSLNNRTSFPNIPKRLFHICVYGKPVQPMQRLAEDCIIHL